MQVNESPEARPEPCSCTCRDVVSLAPSGPDPSSSYPGSISLRALSYDSHLESFIDDFFFSILFFFMFISL